MTCPRCLSLQVRRSAPSRPHLSKRLEHLRLLSTTTHYNAAPISSNTATQSSARPAPPTSSHQPPAATSTSAAQPFSTPLTPASPRTNPKPRHPKTPPSSIPAGTALKGLNLLKGKTDPLAMEDSAYPPWLWTLIPTPSTGASLPGEGEGDLYAKSANQRKKAAKALRKQEALAAARGEVLGEPEVPIDMQSVDLAGGDAVGRQGEEGVGWNVEAGGVRREITRAMRERRRAKIKETNFLKGVA